MDSLFLEPVLTGGTLVALLALCTLALARRASRRPVLPSAAAAVTRLAALGIAVLAVLRPISVRTEERRVRPRLAVLLDASRSMVLPDAPDGPTRAERMAGLLTRERAAFDRIERAYEVTWLAFGEAVREAVRAAPEPRADATALGDALAYAGGLAGEGRLAGVLVLSDGRVTAGRSPEEAVGHLAARGARVWSVAFGGSENAPDAAVTELAAPDRARLGQTVVVAARLRLRGTRGARLRVRAYLDDLLADGTEIALGPGEDRTVRMRLHPREARLHRVRVKVDALEGEVHLSNNERDTVFAVERGRLRAIHLAGSLSWDARAVRRALARLPDADLIEGRAFIRDRAEAEASGCLSDAALAAHPLVVVLGEGAGGLVTPERAARLAAAVQLEGAGLLLLAGDGSAAKLSRTALAPLMPVRVTLPRRKDPVEALALPPAEEDAAAVLPGSARGGARLRFELERAHPSPDARVLLAAGAAGPALLTRRAGKGRVAVLLARDYGHWKESPELLARLCRWLAGDEPDSPAADPLTLRLSRWRLAPGDRLEITVFAREPARSARPHLTLVGPDGGERALRAEPPGAPGHAPRRWHAIAWPVEPGSWRVRAELAEPGREPTKAEVAFAVEAADAETTEPRPSPDVLTRLARLAGGRSSREEEAASLLAEIAEAAPESERVRTESRRPAWNRWPLLSLAVLMLCTAWIMEAPRMWQRRPENP